MKKLQIVLFILLAGALTSCKGSRAEVRKMLDKLYEAAANNNQSNWDIAIEEYDEWMDNPYNCEREVKNDAVKHYFSQYSDKAKTIVEYQAYLFYYDYDDALKSGDEEKTKKIDEAASTYYENLPSKKAKHWFEYKINNCEEEQRSVQESAVDDGSYYDYAEADTTEAIAQD